MSEKRNYTPARKPRLWTTGEVSFLRRNAGILSVDEIGEKLGRSENAIRSKASELRRQGEPVSLRVLNPPYIGAFIAQHGEKESFVSMENAIYAD